MTGKILTRGLNQTMKLLSECVLERVMKSTRWASRRLILPDPVCHPKSDVTILWKILRWVECSSMGTEEQKKKKNDEQAKDSERKKPRMKGRKKNK